MALDEKKKKKLREARHRRVLEWEARHRRVLESESKLGLFFALALAGSLSAFFLLVLSILFKALEAIRAPTLFNLHILRRTFSGLVARSVLLRRAATCSSLAIMASAGFALGLSAYFNLLMSAAAAWYLIDMAVIYYRLQIGQYGNTHGEVLEAARYVTRHLKGGGGGGGGHFDNVFEPTVRQSATDPSLVGDVAGARS